MKRHMVNNPLSDELNLIFYVSCWDKTISTDHKFLLQILVISFDYYWIIDWRFWVISESFCSFLQNTKFDVGYF